MVDTQYEAVPRANITMFPEGRGTVVVGHITRENFVLRREYLAAKCDYLYC